jgi:hypothetical protein
MLLHMGGVSGWRSFIGIIPKQKFGFVILSNFGAMRVSCVPEAIRSKIMDLLLDLESKDWSLQFLNRHTQSRQKYEKHYIDEKIKNPRTHASLQSYEGEFSNDLYGVIRIITIKKNGKEQLILNYKNKQIPLLHWNGDDFVFEGYDLSPFYCEYDKGHIEFGVKDGKSMLAYINLMYEGRDPLFRRKQDKE